MPTSTLTATTDSLEYKASFAGGPSEPYMKISVTGDFVGVLAFQIKDAEAADSAYLNETLFTTFNTTTISSYETKIFGRKEYRAIPISVTSGSASVTLETNV